MTRWRRGGAAWALLALVAGVVGCGRDAPEGTAVGAAAGAAAPAASTATASETWRCEGGDDVAAELRAELDRAGREALAAFATGETARIWRAADPRLRETAPEEAFVAQIAAVAPRFAHWQEARLADLRHVTFDGAEGVTSVRCGAADESLPEHLELVYEVHEEEVALVVHRMPGERGMGWQTTLLFARETGAWRLLQFHLGAYAQLGHELAHYERRARELLARGDALTALLCLEAAMGQADLGPAVADANEKRLFGRLSRLAELPEVKTLRSPPWPVAGTPFEVRNVGLVVAGDGAAPRFVYGAKAALEQATTRAEAGELLAHLLRRHPGLAEEFPHAILTAVGPSTPDGKAPSLTVVLPTAGVR